MSRAKTDLPIRGSVPSGGKQSFNQKPSSDFGHRTGFPRKAPSTKRGSMSTKSPPKRGS